MSQIERVAHEKSAKSQASRGIRSSVSRKSEGKRKIKCFSRETTSERQGSKWKRWGKGGRAAKFHTFWSSQHEGRDQSLRSGIQGEEEIGETGPEKVEANPQRPRNFPGKRKRSTHRKKMESLGGPQPTQPGQRNCLSAPFRRRSGGKKEEKVINFIENCTQSDLQARKRRKQQGLANARGEKEARRKTEASRGQ